jgi:hypothetical protein
MLIEIWSELPTIAKVLTFGIVYAAGGVGISVLILWDVIRRDGFVDDRDKSMTAMVALVWPLILVMAIAFSPFILLRLLIEVISAKFTAAEDRKRFMERVEDDEDNEMPL